MKNEHLKILKELRELDISKMNNTERILFLEALKIYTLILCKKIEDYNR